MSLRAKRRNLAATRMPNGIGDGRLRLPARLVGAAGLVLSAILGAPNDAEARPARCFTSDDGFYDCDFAAGPRGGFTISAPGKPTFILDIDWPGIAFGFAELGGRNVPLPGRYRRSETDRACWDNDATGARICAWSRP
jgi:hypothetical protein